MRHRFRSTAAFGAAALLTGGLFAPAHQALATTRAALDFVPDIHSTFMSASATQPPTMAECVQNTGFPCYDPAQLQTAYDEGPLFSQGLTGAGQTIVVTEFDGSPTIRSDVATFDRAFNLPNPPSLQIVEPDGPVPAYDPTNLDQAAFATETTLDVEWAHAMAPGANILIDEIGVSEDTVTQFEQLIESENYVIDHHLGGVISQSFGSTEQTIDLSSLLSTRQTYVNAQKAGVTVLGSAGDRGSSDLTNNLQFFTFPVTDWPATDPLVTAVGGTKLSLNAAGQRTAADTVWNDTGIEGIPAATGGGLSTIFARPSYQDAVATTVGNYRGIPDISMSGACSAPVLIYASFTSPAPLPPAGFSTGCGTSESAPLFAGIVALADQWAGHPLGLINPALYQLSAQHAPGLVDITSGNNGVSFTQDGSQVMVPGFSAGPGYDLASGVGTVDAARFVPELAAAATGSNQGDQG
ncbi:MAG: S53 family peptidase [Acidimicrobiaceae bacterium]|nr:S53 family peptidase [Acidimicrobiaceae bacterium]